jgi:hypothetical protein
MIRPDQAYARRLSKLTRTDRLLARAVRGAARPAKTPPPGYGGEKHDEVTRYVIQDGERVKLFVRIPKEWL